MPGTDCAIIDAVMVWIWRVDPCPTTLISSGRGATAATARGGVATGEATVTGAEADWDDPCAFFEGRTLPCWIGTEDAYTPLIDAPLISTTLVSRVIFFILKLPGGMR
ncbi:hypothetical protein AA103196_2574 [Ameyamaea chiangmaiensis NBRC 103196]|nr:hypothetical protein AA103196_2574 [Ameyamaea chiangmaiensis NBRC 103196]